MGKPMIKNLIKNGYTNVIGYDNKEEINQRLAQEGVSISSDLTRDVSQADIVLTMLPDSCDVCDVCRGEEGVFAHARPGTIVLDHSTISPSASIKVSS